MSLQGAPFDGAQTPMPIGFGRVAIVPPPAFALMERSRLRKEATPYSIALRGDKCNNELSRVYFGAANVGHLNQRIAQEVLAQTGFAIGPQDQDALKILMRDVFLEFALNRDDQVNQQVDQLNAIVIQKGAKTVIEAAASHQRYLQDISQMHTPICHPVSASIKGAIPFRPWQPF
jgi:hypothetical protein